MKWHLNVFKWELKYYNLVSPLKKKLQLEGTTINHPWEGLQWPSLPLLNGGNVPQFLPITLLLSRGKPEFSSALLSIKRRVCLESHPSPGLSVSYVRKSCIFPLLSPLTRKVAGRKQEAACYFSDGPRTSVLFDSRFCFLQQQLPSSSKIWT